MSEQVLVEWDMGSGWMGRVRFTHGGTAMVEAKSDRRNDGWHRTELYDSGVNRLAAVLVETRAENVTLRARIAELEAQPQQDEEEGR